MNHAVEFLKNFANNKYKSNATNASSKKTTLMCMLDAIQQLKVFQYKSCSFCHKPAAIYVHTKEPRKLKYSCIEHQVKLR